MEVDPLDDPRVVPTLEAYAAEMLALVGAPATSIRIDDLDRYRRPDGAFLLALGEPDEVAGCGALRRVLLPDGVTAAEVKRMWVAPAFRGTGLGRRILTRLHDLAVDLGYAVAVLDTRADLREANLLYRAAGYLPCAPYNGNHDADTWMSRELVSPR